MVSSRKCRNWIWLVAGTEDGVWAARQLLDLSVPVRIQVVSPGACRAYGPLTANPAFQCQAMALSPADVRQVLAGPAPPALVVDATHPFALRITRTLHAACGASATPYLRLQRPQLQPEAATVVDR
ncbi:precorrin-6A/cobalt-precorrin-6A reductase, partial [Candidatus Synechococcus spongiarum]|uniref:precorrin-6A/cobalt-precorrin-6A reductase n=1 Tax=Candidatus Synechococcus spongiarum TaxID=431041 RepID=UPI001F4678AB